MIKTIIPILMIINLCFSQTSLYGLEGWYYISTMATAGGTGSISNINNEVINPATIAKLPKQIQFSLIKYPAGINAQGLQFVKSFKKYNIGIGLRRLDYGDFNASDDSGNESGTYSAGDTWLSSTFSSNSQNFNWGVSGGIFLSKLESYNAAALIFSTGILYDIPKGDFTIGTSLSNFGLFISRYTNQKEQLPTKIIFSMSKGLAHLPLKLNADAGYYLNSQDLYGRIGGIFSLPHNIGLSFGVNTNNINQQTEYNTTKSLLGSSGIGLSYDYKQYSIEIGGYSYGSGGWIYGTGFNVKL